MYLSKTRVVIVGAGQAGGRAAEALRAGHLGSITAGRNMADEANDYGAPPCFWSDQDDASIQIVGHPGVGAKIVRGDSNRRFTTLSIRETEVVGGLPSIPRETSPCRVAWWCRERRSAEVISKTGFLR